MCSFLLCIVLYCIVLYCIVLHCIPQGFQAYFTYPRTLLAGCFFFSPSGHDIRANWLVEYYSLGGLSSSSSSSFVMVSTLSSILKTYSVVYSFVVSVRTEWIQYGEACRIYYVCMIRRVPGRGRGGGEGAGDFHVDVGWLVGWLVAPIDWWICFFVEAFGE